MKIALKNPREKPQHPRYRHEMPREIRDDIVDVVVIL